MYRKVPWVRIPLSPPTSLLLQRLIGRAAGHRRNPRRFAGLWASVFAFPKRRSHAAGPRLATGVHSLRGRLRRFVKGMRARPSPERRASFMWRIKSHAAWAPAARPSERAPANGDRKLTSSWSPSPVSVGRTPSYNSGPRPAVSITWRGAARAQPCRAIRYTHGRSSVLIAVRAWCTPS